MAPQDEIDALKTQVAELSARLQRLEQQLAAAPARRETAIPRAPQGPPPRPAAAMPASGAGTPAAPQKPLPQRLSTPLTSSAGDVVNLERKIGQDWLNRIGIIAILIGVSYFLKYAFENNWIGPSGRVTIGLFAGIALVVWSEKLRSLGHKAFSYSLKAVGIGTLYLSLWGAFQIYRLVPAWAAFVAMVLVTAATITLAIAEDAELLGSFALIGGFATPLLLSTGQNREIVLFSYVCVLDLAILAMAIAKPWRRLLWGSFAGTIILYGGWYAEFYTANQRSTTVLFACLMAAIFAVVPVATRHEQSTRFPGPSITLTLLPLSNAAALFLALYQVYEGQTATLTWYALALAAVYLGISSAFRRRLSNRDTRFVSVLHVAIAVAFITIAIPLKLNAHWVTLGWLIESAVLLWISVRIGTHFLRYLAITALALGILRLLAFDRFQTATLVFNARFGTYLVAVAILAVIVRYGELHVEENERPMIGVALILLNFLALVALTWEASDYFDRQLIASQQGGPGGINYLQLRLARDFSYSAIWLVYGCALMGAGFWKRSAFVRWQALVLMALTIAKVFLYDVSALDRGYRILSFVILGAVLLAVSFIYQRDWLKLTPPTRE
jgi:uncharacterized membrane protein